MPAMLPAIFFGHGNPMNALQSNGYTTAWQRVGQAIARPRAIPSISAHWYVPEMGVTITTAPQTIHDFGGFRRSSYLLSYPPLARRAHFNAAAVRLVSAENGCVGGQ